MTAADVARFQQHWPDRDALRWLIAEQLTNDGRRIAGRSRETATHFKWLLAQANGVRVWLHEFKRTRERRGGFASTVHNHRYPFKAIALTGSYVNCRYEIGFERASLSILQQDVLSHDPFADGATYVMAPEEFHRVESIADGTQSLVIEFAPVASSSFSFEPGSEYMIEHIPLEVRVDHLLAP